MTKTMNQDTSMGDGPVVTRKIKEMSAGERREIDRLIARAYIRHGFHLAQKYSAEAAQSRYHLAQQEQAAEGDVLPHGGLHNEAKDILRRMEQAGRPLSKVVIV